MQVKYWVLTEPHLCTLSFVSSALSARYLAISSSSSFNFVCICSLSFTCCFVGTPGGGGFGFAGKSFSSNWVPVPAVPEDCFSALRPGALRASRRDSLSSSEGATVSSVELRERLTERRSFERESISSPSKSSSSLAGGSASRRRSRLFRRRSSETEAAAPTPLPSSVPRGHSCSSWGMFGAPVSGLFHATSSSNLDANYKIEKMDDMIHQITISYTVFEDKKKRNAFLFWKSEPLKEEIGQMSWSLWDLFPELCSMNARDK